MKVSPSAAPESLPTSADTAVAGILAALELRQPGARNHAERVAETAVDLTGVLDPGLAAQSGIAHAYLLHDIGKLGVPDAIILKPGRLTAGERRIMQTHTKRGEEMVRRLRFLSPLVRDVVACHHERWDGRGYPHGLGAWAIPLAARIAAVADAFDAMTHDRPYRAARPRRWALAELERCARTQFDPTVVEAFLQLQNAGLAGDQTPMTGNPLLARAPSAAGPTPPPAEDPRARVLYNAAYTEASGYGANVPCVQCGGMRRIWDPRVLGNVVDCPACATGDSAA
jgi:HD-GYP domain-containing protein (c-di-GMP phosphodiesterase class II)